VPELVSIQLPNAPEGRATCFQQVRKLRGFETGPLPADQFEASCFNR
jgi:hypothetical protein